ncbi:hypothetical protein J1605_006038 [Eschrichtius robustus]|uniref:Uncharacterized protein n=1 Tax=Eschrichtius robustus TaxID=9764 RepID=A0AB34H4C1_ESCRO|nr:hypothetical protein J1605_006038 [Eschrichtius robustus]
MGKEQELVQAVKAEDVGTAQRLLQRPRPGKARLSALVEKGKGLLGPSAYPHLPSSLPPTQAPEAVLCSSFIQGTYLHEVQPPSPRQAAVLGPSRVSSVPMGIGGAPRPQGPLHPIPALFLFEETSGWECVGGEMTLARCSFSCGE